VSNFYYGGTIKTKSDSLLTDPVFESAAFSLIDIEEGSELNGSDEELVLKIYKRVIDETGEDITVKLLTLCKSLFKL
jgi:hypothetical protein